MKSQLKSVEFCSRVTEVGWIRWKGMLWWSLILCSFIIWVGPCMKVSNAQQFVETDNFGSSSPHRISKRVVSTFSPFLHPRVAGSFFQVDDNKIDNSLAPSSESSLFSHSKLNLRSNPISKFTFPSSSRNSNPILFRDSSFRFPSETTMDKTRSGRTFDHTNKATVGNEKLETTLASAPPMIHVLPPPGSFFTGEGESSRKASPDVQDIIDGIVKLLGGRVHNPQTQQQSQISPVQTNQQRPYNLFNPTKPIYYNPTVKPSRINNRGPPLPTQLAVTINQKIHQNQPAPQSTFEAIPLEALNTGFNLTQSKFGPPFSLTSVIPGAEPPFKQGVPLPQQLVPLQNSGHLGLGTGSETYNNNFNINNNPNGSGGSGTYSDINNGNGQNPNHPFYKPAGEKYNIHRQQQQVNPENQNGENVPSSSQHLWPTQPSSSSSSSSSTGSDINTNNQNIPEYSPPPLISHHNNNPGTIVNFKINNAGSEVETTIPSQKPSTPSTTTLLVPVTSPVNLPPSNKPAVNYGQSGTSIKSPIQTQLQTDSVEDDEADAEKEEKKILKNIQKPNVTVETILEPEITEISQLSTFQLDPSISSMSSSFSPSSSSSSSTPSVESTITMQTTFEFSTFSIKSIEPTTSLSPTSLFSDNKIRPTTSSQIFPGKTLTTGFNINGNNNNWGFNIFPSSSSSSSSPDPSVFYQTNPSRAPVQIQLNGMTRPTPALRPGIVIHEGSPSPTPAIARPPVIPNQGFGSVEVVSAEGGSNPTGGKVGETFDITVTAKQNYGGQVTGQPFVIPVDLKDEIITAPEGNQQFVSIDGKRTYFNLHPSTATGIGTGGQTKTIAQLPIASSNPPVPSHPGIVGAPSHPFAKPSSTNTNIKNTNVPSRAVSTSLSISSGSKQNGTSISTSLNIHGGIKTPPNLIRRPLTRRPAVQSVRIDTCIVGDDSTCNAEQFEICRTEGGVSSCLCRAGYARKRHREPCKAIVALVLSIRLDKLGDKKLSYNADYFNQNSDIYQSLEWETIHGLDSIMSETNLNHGYIGAKLDAVGFDGRHAVVNSTLMIQENLKIPINQVTRELQRQIIQVLTKNRNNFGKSQLWVETPMSAISSVTDVNECDYSELQDCASKANCINTFGSFECKCEFGFGDPYENVPRRSGRKCETCNGKNYCNSRGECQIEEGQKVCKCSGNFYGSQCEIDGEVLAVAIGASVSALVIIGLTLACLCMWSRRWKREEQKAALMSRTLFGGMASQALSYLSKNSMNNSNPYQQHITLDERLRWAQVADTNMNGNIYVNEPLSMHASPGLLGPGSMMETPPMMSARRSADTCDTTVDDLFEERHPTKRPKSRSSQMQNSIYYDLEPEPQSEIYGTRAPTIMSYPAQFCVPMNPYPHTRGFYN